MVNPTNAVTEVDNSGSRVIYKGLALASNVSDNFRFAANFHAGTRESQQTAEFEAIGEDPEKFRAFVDARR